MVETQLKLDDYVQKILKTKTSADLLKILADFRKGEWTDAERQKVSHTYMRVLENIMKASPDEVKASTAPTPAPANDGPVWYEKM
ncbi:MAG: hypothetical protein K2X77_07345 [Candidatus Obscuribacterales bacterium]|jgi:hypothetical protein|nr:hypothetical protein [Candidatus Obscuribacterales bacterium]